MNHDRTYRPVPYAPALRLRDADGSMRQAPRRSAGYAATHPVPPLKGLPGTRATDVSYRALAPGGAGFCYRICTGTSESRPTAHYSLLTANSSYTFSAKEKDSETGLSYFGSRYYNSDLSVWLSVDPMASKYPSLSPYTYCADNPVKLVDPDGERFRLIGRKTNIAFRNYLLSYKGIDCENIYEAFSLDHNNSNVIMFKDPNITYKQFASHYYETTGEKLKNKDAKKLFNAIKSDVFIEANLVANEAISADCMLSELGHEQITEAPAFSTRPQSGNPALDHLMVEICSDEFNTVFNSSVANFETSDSKFFNNITGDKTMLKPPLGMLVVNACGKSAKQAQETLIRELLDFYDKLK